MQQQPSKSQNNHETSRVPERNNCRFVFFIDNSCTNIRTAAALCFGAPSLHAPRNDCWSVAEVKIQTSKYSSFWSHTYPTQGKVAWHYSRSKYVAQLAGSLSDAQAATPASAHAHWPPQNGDWSADRLHKHTQRIRCTQACLCRTKTHTSGSLP